MCEVMQVWPLLLHCNTLWTPQVGSVALGVACCGAGDYGQAG